jgi:hypothetical protein
MLPLASRIKIALMLFAVAIVGSVPFQKTYDGGRWLVSVTIRSATGKKIVAASAEAFRAEESADHALNHLTLSEIAVDAAWEDPFKGETLEVPIRFNETIHGALFWEYHSFSQPKKMVVIARYDDGTSKGRLVELPNLRHSRAVEVEFP